MKKSFSKEQRLLKRWDYKRLARDGRRLTGEQINVTCAKRNFGKTRLGITASTHYGNAPERNRFKRLVREAFRLSLPNLPAGVDLNVAPRKRALTATLAEIRDELHRLLC